MNAKEFLKQKGIFDTQYIVDCDGESIDLETLLTKYHTLQLQQTGVSDCTHENTSFKHIRCNVCDDCGDVIEIDV